jgi:predicted MFS family arabinose efflux permease
VLLGVTHGLLPAAVFPSIALIVPPKLVGSAYGLLTSALNAALFLSPFLLGIVPEWLGTAAASSFGTSPSLIVFSFARCNSRS